MENSNQPAFPINVPDGDRKKDGLTKRELIAAMAMQGMLSTCNGFDNNPVSALNLAKCAVTQAEALLTQLSTSKE